MSRSTLVPLVVSVLLFKLPRLANLGQSGVAAVRDEAMLVLSDGREVRLAAR